MAKNMNSKNKNQSNVHKVLNLDKFKIILFSAMLNHTEPSTDTTHTNDTTQPSTMNISIGEN